MIGPMPGITLMSIDEKRIRRNTDHSAAQITRQETAAVRNLDFGIR